MAKRETTGTSTFPTAIGEIALGWTPRGIARVLLPGGDPAEAPAERARELGFVAADPPARVGRAAERIARLLDGDRRVRLEREMIDLEGVPEFRRRVYEAARSVRPGQTITYGELAERAGAPGAARAVGGAMAANPVPILVPCHRVLAAGGRPGGFSAPGGLDSKARLLGIEGVVLERPWSRVTARRALAVADPVMGRLIDAVGPLRLEVSDEGGAYEMLLRSIVFQQLAGAAAATIFGRVCALVDPPRVPTPREIRRLSDDKLRSAGLSRPKLAAIRDLAAKAEDGTVPPLALLSGLSDDEIVERLVTVRGIGRWTVEMFLIARLGRPDVLPVDDYGVRKGFARWYGGELPSPRELGEYGERWAPYRTAASWYLWRANDLLLTDADARATTQASDAVS